jgi:hypothetical protein
MISKIMLTAALLSATTAAHAFCGFYVAKADTRIFNQASQVILVRDGNQTVITMSNDFKGDVKDFAMVVPVPTVLKESDIKVVERQVFDRLDAYSAPRLVEYYDNDPCSPHLDYEMAVPAAAKMGAGTMAEDAAKSRKDYGVSIEAKYTVGEYDILILSAEQSNGLQRWLNDNGYKIPPNAEEVLNPYIKNNLKFFVVKVNIEKMEDSEFQTLRPLQIKFNARRFGLPIRLGMANANGDQDLIVYAFTKQGRVESTNYRTMKMTSDIQVPEFVEEKFGPFYADAYKKAWKREGEEAIFLEYAWDVSSRNFVKCDPCVSNPPTYADLRDAGVWWVKPNDDRYSSSADFSGDVFFTRMHVRYNRAHYAQDLAFQITPNTEQYQVRYIITHPAYGTFNCSEGRRYIRQVAERREKELQNMNRLAGWNMNRYHNYVDEWNRKNGRTPNKVKQGAIGGGDTRGIGGWVILGFLLMQGLATMVMLRRGKPKS